MENGDDPKDPKVTDIPATPEEPVDDLADYRKDLVATVRLLDASYDKLLVTLAGGALALSIAFLKDAMAIEDTQHASLLLLAWSAFILSLTSVLGRILFGIWANKEAIKKVDDGTIRDGSPGGVFSKWTKFLHALSAIALVVGLSFIVAFAYFNLGAENVRKETTTCTEAQPEAETTTGAGEGEPETANTEVGTIGPAAGDDTTEEKVEVQ